jgi:hypothetical protein
MTLLNYSVNNPVKHTTDFIKKNHSCFGKNSVHICPRRPSSGTAVTRMYKGRQN